MHHHRRERDHQEHHNNLDHDKGYRAPIDLTRGDGLHALAGDAVDVGIFWGDRTQIEQRESKWWMHERGLHVDTEDDAEPDQVDAELFRSRSKQWNNDEGEFEEIEEERQNKDKGVDENQETD